MNAIYSEKEKIKELLEKGKRCGYLYDDEIIESLPENKKKESQEIFSLIKDIGIDVVPAFKEAVEEEDSWEQADTDAEEPQTSEQHNSIADQETIKALIDKGRKDGFLTYDEVVGAVPKMHMPFDDVIDYFEQMEFQIVDSEMEGRMLVAHAGNDKEPENYRHTVNSISKIDQQEITSSVVLQEKSATEQNSTDFDRFFESEKYELLYNELKKSGITTLDALREINLWPFMNFHKLYSIQQRLEISTELTAKLRNADNKNDEQSSYICEIYYNSFAYKGSSPSEAFVTFLTAIATKYPLKIRNLLESTHPETGKVVVSRYYSNSKLRMINPDAYVDSDLSLEQVKLYIAWVIERCGATPKEYTVKENGKIIEAQAKFSEESVYGKSGSDADTSAEDVPKEENRLDETPTQDGVCNSNISLIQEVEDYLLQCDLSGATYDEIQSKLDDTMVGTKRFVAQAPHIIELSNKLYHVDAFVDFDEAADTIESILDKLLKKNNSITTAKQLYEYARSEMFMFLNDNGITEQQSVYDLARHLFEKIKYHGKKYVFRYNMYISLPEVSADSAIDIIKKYAREKGSTVTIKEIESYLTGLGLNTVNLRGVMKIDKEPVFFVYAENEYLLAELIHIDDAFLKAVHSALRRLFSDCNGHIVLRHISDSWYNLLPSLPASLSWTPMLLQQLISYYQDELEARTVIAMESQNSNALHAMLVEKESWIQDFRDVVAIFLHDEMPNRSEFEAEELRKILVDAGMISGNQLIRHMHIALGSDSRFLWNSDGTHVKVWM